MKNYSDVSGIAYSVVSEKHYDHTQIHIENDLLLALEKDEMDPAGVIVQPQHTGGPGIS
ncbi:MAG: hypothetical protein R2874_00525 [Desulfobacterales bacterium]